MIIGGVLVLAAAGIGTWLLLPRADEAWLERHPELRVHYDAWTRAGA